MHLLREWKRQEKKISCTLRFLAKKEDIQPIVECTLKNDTDFTLTDQWTGMFLKLQFFQLPPVMILIEQERRQSRCHSFPITFLDCGYQWLRNIPLEDELSDYLPFHVTVFLNFYQFSIQLQRTTFNILDMVEICESSQNSNKLRTKSVFGQSKKRIHMLFEEFNKGRNLSNLVTQSDLSNYMHGFKFRINPLEEQWTHNWEQLLRVSLSDTLWTPPQSTSNNNFTSSNTLRTYKGEEFRMRIAPNEQSHDVLLQGNKFSCLLSARQAFLQKLDHTLKVRERSSELVHARMAPKEELVELIKSAQNLQKQVVSLFDELQNLELAWTEVRSPASSPGSTLRLVREASIMDRNLLELLKEIRQQVKQCF